MVLEFFERYLPCSMKQAIEMKQSLHSKTGKTHFYAIIV